jgi:uncharacterized protein YfaS (alpha-2-macroglobulin family)
MSSRTKIVLTLSLGALALAGGSAAWASSATGNQNPDLVVNASVVSDGSDPEVATAGDTIQADFSVTNVSDQRQWVHFIEVDGTLLKGKDIDHLKQLEPGQSMSWSKHVKVKDTLASGLYTLDVYGLDTSTVEASTAEATITVDNG